MKVVIRSSQLTSQSPEIIATYDDATDIASDAHGPDTMILSVPQNVVTHEIDESGGLLPPKLKLAVDWRERASKPIIAAEAKRRTDEAFTLSEQMNTLHELVSLVVQHGTDVAKWPAEAKTRKAEIDEMWNYINEISKRARTHSAASSAPVNPTNDKIWPTRLKSR